MPFEFHIRQIDRSNKQIKKKLLKKKKKTLIEQLYNCEWWMMLSSLAAFPLYISQNILSIFLSWQFTSPCLLSTWNFRSDFTSIVKNNGQSYSFVKSETASGILMITWDQSCNTFQSLVLYIYFFFKKLLRILHYGRHYAYHYCKLKQRSCDEKMCAAKFTNVFAVVFYERLCFEKKKVESHSSKLKARCSCLPQRVSNGGFVVQYFQILVSLPFLKAI